MPAEVAAKNISKMTAQLKLLFQNARSYAVSHGFKEGEFGKVEIINNDNWWKDFKFSDFLTKVAQYMRLGPMIARDR
jgi:tyrosyl-tRNA synthetase